MDMQKEKIAHEKHLLSQGVDFKYLPNIQYNELENVYELIEWGEEYSEALNEINSSWCTWQAAKAQAVQGWISVEDNLPETEPNTDGVVCAVVCSLGNVYRARYVHDVDVGVDTKYWSEFAVNYNGKEYEHYEINAKITHWMPLPEPPTKDKGGKNA